ncbi:MAG: hypothetical protein IKO72_11680 [Kiritimatiellae bacterium]|nr:hypothetical protein [Kiritimatiellia bacterium]
MKSLASILLVLAAGVVFAGAEGDGFELTTLKPLDIVNTQSPSDWSAANANSLYLSGGGFAATGEDRPAAMDNNRNVAYRLANASYGMMVSEQKPDFYLGDWCTVLPTDNPDDIDWERTGEGIRNSAAYRDDGMIYYNPSATNDMQRILFTRGGTVAVNWYMRGSNEPIVRTYQIASTASTRPFRIFWTENGFAGPTVSLGSRTNPKHVRLLGNPEIVRPSYSDPVYAGDNLNVATSNIVFGVHADDSDTYLIRVYAKRDESGLGNHVGPRGQFVMAYYDSGSKDNLIYTIVVEVSEPDVDVLTVNVGDRLMPVGSGYSTDFLEASVIAGDGTDIGDQEDAVAPYLYKHSGFSSTSPKSGFVYAIAPTDASSQAASGLDAPHKAKIWWMTQDPMGTKWPFEYDHYLIKWGESDPIVVTSSNSVSGAGIMVPEDYTVQLCGYSDPANIATVVSNTVYTSGAGHFTLKIVGNDNVWFLPMRSCLDTDASVFDQRAGEWHVGTEIVLRADSAAGIAAGIAAQADASLPGYIYEPGSPGRNWNPNLYHAPRLVLKSEVSAAESSAHPLDTLASAIYAVRASDDPIEVWWYRSWKADDMPAPISFPTVAQRYKAIWPLPTEAHSIVLASQLGSAGKSYAASGQALYLNISNSTAYADNLVPGSMETGATIGFWINGRFRAAEYDPVAGGRVLTAAGGAFTIDVSADMELSICGTAVSVPTNAWTHVACAVCMTNGTLTIYCNGETVATAPFAGAESFVTNECQLTVGALGGTASATGIGIDHLCVWPFAVSGEDLALYAAGGMNESTERRRYSWTFDTAGDLGHIAGVDFRMSADDGSGRTLTSYGCLAVSPGGPCRSNGTIAALDGIAPRIYVQNNPDGIGYNPNEEHAFVREESAGYTVYALRCDLNRADSSEPFVMVEYSAGGKGAMRMFYVTLTNDVYNTLASEVTVGNLLAGPHPLDYLDGYYNTKNYCQELSLENDSYVIYRDRLNRMWARRDGTTMQFNYYPVLDGFYFPSLPATEQPEVGTLVGWMAFDDTTNAPTATEITGASPLAWTWHASWPPDDKIPFMRVAQTLTTADSGLPEVWNALSMAVVYPVPRNDGADRSGTVVTLIDPTVAQTASLSVGADFAAEYNFTVGPAGTCQLKSGKYYFTGVPPNISDRFYIDMNAAESNRMVLVGKMVEKKAGTSYLQVNVLSDAERAALRDICKASGDAKTRWVNAVNSLATNEVCPSVRSIVEKSVNINLTDLGTIAAKTRDVEVKYSPVDHYALVANGCGTNYVTLIENDSDDESVVPAGSTISMHILKVVPELYAGGLVVLQDPNNKLSEQLNVLYTAPFGKSADNFEFEWRKRQPPADGHVPDNYADWTVKTNGTGATDILLGGGGANLLELVNTYYVMRYRAKSGTPAYGVTGDTWSGWCGPTLAEGWVQRVLNNVTPFAQRISDFYVNATELNYTMPEQIGGPYRGDVALNDSNLENVGLVELYQTVLNKAESLSLALGINDVSANKQLLEAVSRLADLYTLLGDDAYSDASNPTISVGSTGEMLSTLDMLPANTYCFANQVPSLLDEELALLRGRSSAVAPNMTTYPYYNRLMWNFTKGITQGEMAYVQNYGIMGDQGEITAEQAAAQYPMGHGDAYGHYLSAIWGYYRLLRNPYFSWGDPGMMEMLVADSIVNMDYEDEQKFAMAAAKMAQTGVDVVDRTARKTWRDQNGDTPAGYFDADQEQGFGYGEWAVRTGLGALYNWATVNSLLPTNRTASVFADKSIADVTRATVPALGLLAGSFAAVDRKINTLDAGLNPLGLSDNAIPFDIDPVKVAAGTSSHFEQILERAERALDNAQTVLEHANKYGSRMRQITLAEGNDAHELEQFEMAYKKDLIAIYGKPFPDDIGPAGTYEQGYDGPDIYHYQYMDLAPYGLENLSLSQTTNIYVYKMANASDVDSLAYGTNTNGTVSIVYNVSPGGIVVKPSGWNSVRPAEGSIQAAYRDFLSAYVDVRHSLTVYKGKIDELEREVAILTNLKDKADYLFTLKATLGAFKEVYNAIKFTTDIIIDTLDNMSSTSELVTDAGQDVVPWIVAGLAAGSNVGTAVANTTLNAVNVSIQTAGSVAKGVAQGLQDGAANVVQMMSDGIDITEAYQTRYSTYAELKEKLAGLLANVYEAANGIQSAYGALVKAEAAYRAEVARGDLLLAEREMLRKQQSNNAVANRYAEMYYRVQFNSALSKYSTAYDVAQRYVWQLAKVYDYETGLLSSDRQAGDAFLRETLATRALGVKGVTVAADGTDGGLWDIVTRMKGNWDVLKGRLSVNNPDTSTKWFSLRYSMLRIKPDASGDSAWRQALNGYWMDDLLSNAEFLRHCQPPQYGVATREPGLVIPFSTTINLAENFFGKPLLGGETTFSSSDYAVKINAVGIEFVGYDGLAVTSSDGLAVEPNVYLVPVGQDYMRAPAGTTRKTLSFKVVDQVLPLPYEVGSAELNALDWLATFSGLDGTTDSSATIRRHSTIRVSGDLSSSRLVGRSVWNDRWLLVIPASSLSSDRVRALKTFINGLDTDRDGRIDIPGVADIRIGIKSYARQGN